MVAQNVSRAIVMPSCVLLSMCMPLLLGFMCAHLSMLALCQIFKCQVDPCLLYTASLKLSHSRGPFCIGRVKTLDRWMIIPCLLWRHKQGGVNHRHHLWDRRRLRVFEVAEAYSAITGWLFQHDCCVTGSCTITSGKHVMTAVNPRSPTLGCVAVLWVLQCIYADGHVMTMLEDHYISHDCQSAYSHVLIYPAISKTLFVRPKCTLSIRAFAAVQERVLGGLFCTAMLCLLLTADCWQSGQKNRILVHSSTACRHTQVLQQSATKHHIQNSRVHTRVPENTA